MRKPTAQHFLSGTIVLVLLLDFVVPGIGAAYDAMASWRPVAGAAGYQISIAFDDGPFAAPSDLGSPVPESDGVIRAVVTDLPIGPMARFELAAYDGMGRVSDASNEITVTYAQVAAVVDSDGDGLTDAEEDSDLDRQVDVGETDPANADTDGDGASDGAEVAAGTDPTSPDPPLEPRCGDGVVDAGEACDDGNSSNEDACLNDCQPASCGDGIVYKGVEECDEGAANSDIADGACRTDCTRPGCTPEDAATACDDGNSCTDEVCSGGNCKHSFNTVPCNDGITCTSEDTCAAGVCRGLDSCPDGSVCNLQARICQSEAAAQGIWVPAAQYPAAEFHGAMTTSELFASGSDSDPARDSALDAFDANTADAIGYRVQIPRDGQWYLWGRLYYPGSGNDANSFWIRVDDGTAARLGNGRDWFQQWHWDGDGDGEYDAPAPLALGFLSAGEHLLSVAKREVVPEAPRLDILFLSDDAAATPTDEDAVAAINACPFGACDGGPLCGDATQNGVLSVTDAWTILRAAIGLDRYCNFGICDVDANGMLNTSDAAAVLGAAIGLQSPGSLTCKPSVSFGLAGAAGLHEITFVVDYANAGIEFADSTGSVLCRSARPSLVAMLESSDDTASKKLELTVRFEETVSGDQPLADCIGYPPVGSRLPGPGAFELSVSDYVANGASKSPPSVGVIPSSQ